MLLCVRKAEIIIHYCKTDKNIGLDLLKLIKLQKAFLNFYPQTPETSNLLCARVPDRFLVLLRLIYPNMFSHSKLQLRKRSATTCFGHLSQKPFPSNLIGS